MTPFRERLDRVADQATADITLTNPASANIGLADPVTSQQQIASVTHLEQTTSNEGDQPSALGDASGAPTAPVFNLAAERSRRRSAFLVLTAAAAVAVATMGASAVVANLDRANQATATIGVDGSDDVIDEALPGGRVEVAPHVVEWSVDDEATLVVQHRYTGEQPDPSTPHPEVVVMVNDELFALESGPSNDSDGTVGVFVFSPSLRPGTNEVEITALFDSGQEVRLTEVVAIAD